MFEQEHETIVTIDDLRKFLNKSKASGKRKEGILYDKMTLFEKDYRELVRSLYQFPIDILEFGYDVHMKEYWSLLEMIIEKGTSVYEKRFEISNLCHEIDERFFRTKKIFPTKSQYERYLNLKSTTVERIQDLND